MKNKRGLFLLMMALVICVALLILVMTRINEARTNLTQSSPGAYNYLLQSSTNVAALVQALQEYRNESNDARKTEELRSQYREKFDVVWGGFSIFEINFPTESEQQQQVTELVAYSSNYLEQNELLMAVDYPLSDAEIADLITGARLITKRLIDIGNQYFIYDSRLSDLWKVKLHRLYHSFFVCLVLLLLTGTLLTTLLLRSSRQSATLVEKSFKSQREMKRLIDELRSGKLENKAKDSFIAAASHDLRQPLHALGLFLGATEKHISSEAGRQALAEAKNCATELNKLFNSLLDLSRLDAGVIEIDRVDFKLDRLLRVVDQEFSVQARQAGIAFWVGSSLHHVNSDALLLNRILRNLLDNAITHSGASEIRIICESKADCVRLTVADNGDGIPVAEQEHIFSEYYQLKNPERDRLKGLGLGLSIVKRLCELLNVDITLESNAVDGTKFHLDVPRGMANSHSEPAPVTPSISSSHSRNGVLIAVIDDDASICRGMVAILESMNFDVVAAESADLLIDECQASELLPDILLADYRLRENQTGDMAIRQVRTAFAMDFPAIIITGDTSPGRVKEAAQSGFELLHKPIEPEELVKRITTLLATVTQPSSGVG